MSPARRRQAVAMLRDRLAVSERRACRYVGQHRSTQRREPVVAADDQALRAALRAFAGERKRWGYRRAHHHLVIEEGWQVNRKRVQRLWREEGLRVPQTRRRKRPVGDGPDGRDIHAAAPDEVWALDFQADQTIGWPAAAAGQRHRRVHPRGARSCRQRASSTPIASSPSSTRSSPGAGARRASCGWTTGPS